MSKDGTRIGSLQRELDLRKVIAKLEAENAEMAEALKPFAALLQEHHARLPDSQPIFGINNATIYIGQLRDACAILARIGGAE